MLCMVNVAWADEWDDDFGGTQREMLQRQYRAREQQRWEETRRDLEDEQMNRTVTRNQEMMLQRRMLDEMKKANEIAEEELEWRRRRN